MFRSESCHLKILPYSSKSITYSLLPQKADDAFNGRENSYDNGCNPKLKTIRGALYPLGNYIVIAKVS